MGTQISYREKGLTIKSYLAYHLIDGTLSLPSGFTPTQGLHYTPSDPGLSNQRNYYIADIKISWGDSVWYVYAQRGNQQWGFGKRSLTLSRKIPSFVHIGMNWRILPTLNYNYIHGSLKSGLEEESDNYYWEGKPYNPPDVQRNLAGHRLHWHPHPDWEFVFSELVVYGNRSMEWNYGVPLLPFFPIQGYLGDSDNIIMSAELVYKPHSQMNIYGSFLMDEWSPPYTFKEDNRNWFGWQLGLHIVELFSTRANFRAEFTWTDHRIYRHRFNINEPYSWGFPLGFWAGPHAEEVFVEYQTLWLGNHIRLQYSAAKRGELTSSMLEDQYNRPNDQPVFERCGRNESICDDCFGTTEGRQQFLVKINRNINSNIFIGLSYTFLQWENAGFNPKAPLEENQLPEITKHSLGVEFTYLRH